MSQSTHPFPKVTLERTPADLQSTLFLSLFKRAARKAGWTGREIDAVIERAKAGDHSQIASLLR